MNFALFARAGSRVFLLITMLAMAPAFGADAPGPAPASAAPEANPAAPGDENVIVATKPMAVEADDSGAYEQLVVDPQVLSPGTRSDLVYTITQEPLHGKVGLASGDEEADFFANKRSRLSYFVYRAEDGFEGEDTFSYAVRNETTGLVFRNTVVITVKAPDVVKLPLYVVTDTRDHTMDVRPVMLTTRPNSPITQKVPNHEDFMSPAERENITDPKIAYVLDDKAKPQNGSARLDRATGELTYAPNPGFIGEDHFKYYTVDENHPELGVDNVVTVQVEPIRITKHMLVDRSKSREVDLVFVINNSPSMAAHQERIAANLSRFRQLFDTRDLDYRIAVLTTDFMSADHRRSGDQPYYKDVRSVQLSPTGHPVLDRRGRPKQRPSTSPATAIS